MRKAFIEGISTKFKYDFGADTFIIEAIMKMPESNGTNDITYYAQVNGKRLKEFILEHASLHKDIIKDIIDDEIYQLEGWDW